MRRALNYKNAKIYVIKNHKNELVYVGSTTQPLYKRFSWHKKDMTRLKNQQRPLYKDMLEFGVEHFYIELLEEYPCENIEQLHQREGYWIRELNTYNNGYNGQIQGRSRGDYYQETKNRHLELCKRWVENNKEKVTKYYHDRYEKKKEELLAQRKQYYEKNKNLVLESSKKYRENHKEQIAEWASMKIKCECGAEISRGHMAGHRKTKKHQDALSQKL